MGRQAGYIIITATQILLYSSPDSVPRLPPNNRYGLSVSLVEPGQRNAFSLTRNRGHDNLQ